VKFIEPIEANRVALGFDVRTEPNRRQAAEAARDTGKATLTPSMEALQAPGGKATVEFFLPIYRSGSPLGTVAERRAALLGWVYEPLLLSELMAGLFHPEASDVDFEIYDGDTAASGTLLYDEDFGRRLGS
jgi:CHASE1-domain containing sensor protein